MKLETFFGKFDQFADAPERIPALRKVIFAYMLHSAVSSSDAISSSAILREAHEIRRRELIKNANRNVTPTLPEVADGDLPPSLSGIPSVLFDRLGNISSIQKGLSQIQSTTPGKYPLVVTAETRSSSESFDFYGAAAIIPLVSSTGHGDASLKRLHYQEGRYAVGNILAVVKPICPDLLRARFIYEYLSAFKEELLVSRMVGTANVSLTVNKLKEVPVPLVSGPVLSRLDELMALCDRLEAQQQERETRHAALASASLARFADAPTSANLNYLFHPSFNIHPSDLRKSILTLAVQGKLVPQDPTDEDAEEELKTIQARKAELVRKQAIKKTDPSRPVNPDNVDYEIPDSWAWVRLVEICELITDGTHLTPKYTESGRMFLSAQNLKPFKFMPDKHRFVSEEHYQGYVKNRKPEKGDVLLTRVGAGIGEAATIDQDLDFAIYVSLGLLRPVRGFVFPDYITLWLNSPDGTEKCRRNTYGKGVSQGNLNLSLIRNFLVPLPPLAEQKRIVAKVDQLMSLVDALEQQLAASRKTAEELMKAAVAELTGGENCKG